VSKETAHGEDRPHWTIDRRVPVGIIVSMALQLCGVVWWARGQAADVDMLRERDTQHETRMKKIEDLRDQERLSERLATLETEVKNQTALLRRIDERMDRQGRR
jgi:hypothetical protein